MGRGSEAGEGEVLTSPTAPAGAPVFPASGVAVSPCPPTGAPRASTITRATLVAAGGPDAIGAAIHLLARRRETPHPAAPGAR